MAYNFYQQQKNVSQSFTNQISSLAENIEAEGRQQVENRNEQLQSLSQEQSIEGAEERSQILQLKSSGLASIVEGSVMGIPGIKNTADIVKKGYNALQNIKGVAGDVGDAIGNVKTSLNNITDTLQTSQPGGVAVQSGGDTLQSANIESSARAVEFQNPLFGGMDPDASSVRTEQFGDDIDMTGRQLGSEATPVLPTNTLETPTTSIADAKTAITGSADALPGSTELLGDTTSVIQKVLPKITGGIVDETTSAAGGIFGGIFGDILGGIADVFDPVVGLASAAVGVYGIVKGVEDETAKPEMPALVQPPPLPNLEVLGDVQSTAQVGI